MERARNYKQWLQTMRENLLAKCENEQQKEKLILQFQEKDFLEQFKKSKDFLDKTAKCSLCDSEIKIGTNLLTVCRKCKMKKHREIFYGSLENFKKISTENYKKSCFEKFGVENPRQLKDIQEKATQTRFNKNNGSYRSPEELEKAKLTFKKNFGNYDTIVAKIKQTKKDRYGDENFNNLEKGKATKKDRYGNENYNNSEKSTITRKLRNNGKYFSEDTIKKIKDARKVKQKDITKKTKYTNREKYGVENPMQVPEIAEKSMAMRKLSYPEWTEDHKKHLIEATLKKYGTFNHRNNYYYKNKYFDSSFELVYFIWLVDNKRDFEYHPEQSFEYFKNGKKHFYHPDFRVENDFVELKGPHLINENKTLLDWKGNPEVEKTECLKQNNVKILEEADLRVVFEYVERTYGKKYWRNFVCQKSKV